MVPRTLRPLYALLLSLWIVAPLAATGQPEREQADPDLVIVNMADTHSAYDTYPAILSGVASLADDYEGEDLVFLFNGDLFELGNVVATRSKGEIDWEFLRRLQQFGLVVINVGNHEFDFLSPQAFVEQATQLGVIVIGTVAVADQPDLTPAFTDLSRSGRSVRIVGIGTDALNTYPQPLRESLSIPDPVAWIRDNFADIAEGADYTIVASHAGLVADVEMAPFLNESTIYLVGGHNHIVLRERLNDVSYMHNGFRGERFNVTEIFFTPTGFETRFRDVVTETVAIPDQALADQIETVRRQHLLPEDLAVVGSVSEEMSVLEGAMWAVETLREAVDVDIAFLNHTSFGSGLAQGPLPLHRFNEFMRFDNDVMVAQIDAATLRTVIDRSNQHLQNDLTRRSGDFLYAGDILVEEGRIYTIATSSWVALDFNQERYLGTRIAFDKLEGVTTKGILLEALGQ